jgi:hypothetical protein
VSDSSALHSIWLLLLKIEISSIAHCCFSINQNLKWDYPRIIPAKFALIWLSGFRGEDLNVKVYDVRRTPSDGKSSHGLWPGELKTVATLG